MADFIINSDGIKILDQSPLGDAGQALNDNFTLLGRRSNGFVHNQIEPAAEWTIHHSLGKAVSVTIVDSSGQVVVGDVRIVDLNTVSRWCLLPVLPRSVGFGPVASPL